MISEVPQFDNKFVCIINRSDASLGAIISSYVCQPGRYTPIFEFQSITAGNAELVSNEFDIHYISKIRADAINIGLKNVLIALKGCEYLVLGGLSQEQKSCLDFLTAHNVIVIDTIDEVAPNLSHICEKKYEIFCNETDIHHGTYAAIKSGAYLKIVQGTANLETVHEKQNGIIVIENDSKVSSIIAVNYALACGADIEVIKKPNCNPNQCYQLIEDWQDSKNDNFLNDLGAELYPLVEHINFSEYQFATFMTDGAPYSLVLKNVIPFSYIHSRWNPAFFIFWAIYQERTSLLPSAVVFSPLLFEEEETEKVIKSMVGRHYHVKALIGNDATSYNIGMHVKEYPYDVLHLCSHGGQVDGYHVKHKFIDRDQVEHTCEFDEVVSFAPNSAEELIPVTFKRIYRKFDGHIWKSNELKAQQYPSYVFVDMEKSTNTILKESRTVKKNITDSCAIICSDFHYQAVFNTISGTHSKPFVFNNTCWSWYRIAEAFLAEGARGYVGTLWGVKNNVAKDVAEEFYTNVGEYSILKSISMAMDKAKGTPSANIYIYWGLHFSTIRNGHSIPNARYNVMLKLLLNHSRWKGHLKLENKPDTKHEVARLIRWNLREIKSTFLFEWNVFLNK